MAICLTLVFIVAVLCIPGAAGGEFGQVRESEAARMRNYQSNLVRES
jgi:hypothetical protein